MDGTAVGAGETVGLAVMVGEPVGYKVGCAEEGESGGNEDEKEKKE